MTKKLKIIGPYTPEHPGPFCTRDGRAARIICTDRMGGYPIVALIDDKTAELNRSFDIRGKFWCDNRNLDLMNAEEVPVARDFWVNQYYSGWGQIHDNHGEAVRQGQGSDFIRTIHVREVMPGDAE